jgi:hypothetical protein
MPDDTLPFAAAIASRSVHTPSAPFTASDALVTVIVAACDAAAKSARPIPLANARTPARQDAANRIIGPLLGRLARPWVDIRERVDPPRRPARQSKALSRGSQGVVASWHLCAT